MNPTPFQSSRERGWMKAPGSFVCKRPSRFGNPFREGIHGTRAEVVELHAAWVLSDRALVELIQRTLRGRDLGCSCPLGLPCHRDTLLRIANSTDQTEFDVWLASIDPAIVARANDPAFLKGGL